MSDESLTPLQLASRWKMSPGTLANWRAFGTGPTYGKRGRLVRYRIEDVIEYEKSHSIEAVREAHQSLPREKAQKSKAQVDRDQARALRKRPESRRARRRNGS